MPNTPTQRQKWHIGTSGFSYKEWKGHFYPEKLPAAKMLHFYAERLSAVEINSTFYRVPSVAQLEKWAIDVPEHFKFIFKAPRQITHIKRLKDVGESLGHFFETLTVLGGKLGPVLIQLPPNLKKDMDRLSACLDTVPEGVKVSVEFRHASWFDDEVYGRLRDANAALCVVHSEAGETPFVATADWGYLRLRNCEYTDEGLRQWQRHIGQQPWRAAHVFFKHEDEGTGPLLAARLLKLC